MTFMIFIIFFYLLENEKFLIQLNYQGSSLRKLKALKFRFLSLPDIAVSSGHHPVFTDQGTTTEVEAGTILRREQQENVLSLHSNDSFLYCRDQKRQGEKVLPAGTLARAMSGAQPPHRSQSWRIQ